MLKGPGVCAFEARGDGVLGVLREDLDEPSIC